MKTPFFLAALALVFTASTVCARELPPGTILITGDTSFDDSTVKMDTSNSTIKTDTTTLNLTGSYFIISNFGVGLMVGNEDSDTHYDSVTTNSSIKMIGPMATYSIDVNPSFNIIFNLGVFKVSGDMDEGGGSSFDFDGDGTFFIISGAYFLNDSVALYFGLRRTDADIDLKARFLANPPISASMSDNANVIGFAFLF